MLSLSGIQGEKRQWLKPLSFQMLFSVLKYKYMDIQGLAIQKAPTILTRLTHSICRQFRSGTQMYKQRIVSL